MSRPFLAISNINSHLGPENHQEADEIAGEPDSMLMKATRYSETTVVTEPKCEPTSGCYKVLTFKLK